MILPPLSAGTLVKRYKRFLADIRLDDGSIITAHCPNSGSMLGCNHPGSPVYFSHSNNPNRKLPYTWELVYADTGWVGLNTIYPNRLVHEAILNGTIKELVGYATIRTEVPYGRERSRIDLLLEGKPQSCYVEVKNVTLVHDDIAEFPDAITTRGQKHLRELMDVVTHGSRAVLVFTVQREDASAVRPADGIDPVYGTLLRQAAKHGVEIIAYQALVSPQEIKLIKRLPVLLEEPMSDNQLRQPMPSTPA